MRPYPPLVVLLGAALLLVSPSATAQELGDRFAAAGAELRPGTSATLLGELTALGLVRASRREGDDTRHVITTLGRRYAEAEALDEEGRSRLIDLEALRTDLLSTISHELRTPLTAIRTSAGLLLDPASNPTEAQRRALLEAIVRNGERMQRLVGDILELSRFRSGTISLQLRRFRAVALAASTIALVAPLAATRGQRLDLVDQVGPDHQAFGDHRRLEQALLNLVSNAQKFAPDGGTVTIRVAARGRDTAWSVDGCRPGHQCRGPGAAVRAVLRRPERRDGSARGDRPRAADRARHRPGARRDDRGGQRARAGIHVHPRGAHGRAGGRPGGRAVMRILVVDDEADVVESIRLGFDLQWREVEVLGAGTGEAALDAVEREQPDIVLLDVGLPDVDGFAVLTRIRAFSDVPVVMLTARDDAMDKVKGLELGADDYVTKPFNHLELMARVRAVLRRHDMPAPASRAPSFRSGDLEVDFARQEARLRGERVDLTPTEYKLLYHLVRNAGHVLQHGTLLAKVWGREYVDEVDYVRVYIRRLRDKLGDDPENPRYIQTERRLGYRFIVPR